MNFRQLQAFQEVMRTGSVTRAAQNLGRTQPAISSSIVGLEQSVGYNLFDRKGGRLHPVPEAHFLLSEAGIILERLSNLSQTMKDVGSQEIGHLTVACMPVYAELFMPQLISTFVKDRKNVSVSMASHGSERVYERLASQQFDIGFAEANPISPLVDSDEISMPCVCAVHKSHRLANRKAVAVADFKGEVMASFLPYHFIRRRLEEEFEAAGQKLTVRFEAQNAQSQFPFVEAELASTIVSTLSAHNYKIARPNSDSIRFIPFRSNITYSVAILTPKHKPMSQLALAFSRLLKEELTAIVES